MNFLIQNFEIVSFCNDFSCRSKTSGSLTPKSDYEFLVSGSQLIQRNSKYKGCTSNVALRFSLVMLLMTNLLPLRYFNDFAREFL